MKKQMIISGLTARPVRSIVSILAVTLEVTLIIVIVGLATGIVSEKAQRTAGVGAELEVGPAGSSMFFELSGNTMPVSLGDKIAELPGVKAVAPVQTHINTEDGVETIFGIEPKSFDAVTGGLTWIQGKPFRRSRPKCEHSPRTEAGVRRQRIPSFFFFLLSFLASASLAAAVSTGSV